jgi:hypothetical protein
VAITTNSQEDWRILFIDYLSHGRLTTPTIISQRQQIRIRNRHVQLIDGMKRRYVSEPITEAIITEAHEGIVEGRFATNITLHKLFIGCPL